MLPSQIVQLTSYGVEHTVQLGHRLGALLVPGDIICLVGDLGAGKTAFTRGVGQGWGASESVTSPTFTLIHEHHRPQDTLTLYHVDCYRLQGASDAWGIGLDDLLHGDGIVVIEWPERIETLLPPSRLWIELAIVDDTQRQITIQAIGKHYHTMLENWMASNDG